MLQEADITRLEEPFWNDEMKEQCDQAKSFWKLWIGRQCGKCSRFHLTEEEIEILKEHKENFEDVGLDVIFFTPINSSRCIALHFKSFQELPVNNFSSTSRYTSSNNMAKN